MIDELQKALGELWTVVEALPGTYQLMLPEEELDRDKVFEKLEAVWDVAERHVEAECCPEVDGFWKAAEVLLGPKKLSALQTMYVDTPDSLTAEIVAHALLGEVSTVRDGVRIEIGPRLQKRLEDYIEQKTGELVSEDEQFSWQCTVAFGWTEFLPTEFDIRRLDDGETDEMFIERCTATLMRVAEFFP